MKKIRVIILNFHQIDATIECIKSLSQQNYPLVDVVVVDNAPTAPEIEEIKQKLPFYVKHVVNEKNVGFAAGNNTGTQEFKDFLGPEYYFFLNNDTVLNDPQTIQSLVACLEADEKAAAVSPLINTLSSSVSVRNQIQVRRNAQFRDVVVAYSPLLKRLPFLNKIYSRHVYAELSPIENKVYDVDTINGAAFLIKQTVYEQIGGIDENTFLYFEEIILGNKINFLGLKCMLDGRTIVEHHQGLSSGKRKTTIGRKMFEYEVESQQYFCKKYLKVGNLRIDFHRFCRNLDWHLLQIVGVYRKIYGK